MICLREEASSEECLSVKNSTFTKNEEQKTRAEAEDRNRSCREERRNLRQRGEIEIEERTSSLCVCVCADLLSKNMFIPSWFLGGFNTTTLNITRGSKGNNSTESSSLWMFHNNLLRQSGESSALCECKSARLNFVLQSSHLHRFILYLLPAVRNIHL